MNVGTLSRLNGLIEGNEFKSEAFEDRIDPRRKQSVIACFKQRDLSPQPVGANLAVRQSFHSGVLRTGNCASPTTKRRICELAEIDISRTRVLKGESNYRHLAADSDYVFAAIVLIWEHIGDKASIIVPLPGLLRDISEFQSRSATRANRGTTDIVRFPGRVGNR